MRIVLQKVSSAKVLIGEKVLGSIPQGYLLFLCVMRGDHEEQARWLAEKVVKLRLWPDEADGAINMRSILDLRGSVLVISEFTLSGSLLKGNRPDYTAAATPAEAEKLYTFFIQYLRSLGVVDVASGTFGAMMQVHLVNEGPVTLTLEKE